MRLWVLVSVFWRLGSLTKLSPSWLLHKARCGDQQKYKEAFDSLRKLRHSELQAARDLFLIHHLLEGQYRISKQRHRFIELFTVAQNRRALFASLIVMFMQQFCGVNIFIYVGFHSNCIHYCGFFMSPPIGESLANIAYGWDSTPPPFSVMQNITRPLHF